VRVASVTRAGSGGAVASAGLARALVACTLVAGALVLAAPREAFGAEKERILRIGFSGNRKVEDAAIRAVLSSKQGLLLSTSAVASDVRAIWAMNYFDDVQVRLVRTSLGAILVYVVREKPSVRKIIVSGNDEIELDKINEVLDLKKDAILDVSQIKRNLEKIKELYVEKGFYLADVSYKLRTISRTEVDVTFTIEERAKIVIRSIRFIGNKEVSEKELKSVMGTQEGGYFSFITSSGTYQEEAFERDLVLATALYYDKGYINVKMSRPEVVLSPDKRYLYIAIHVEEGQQFTIGKLDIKGDLLFPKAELMKKLSVKQGELFNRSKLGKDITYITEGYKDKGYAYVNATPLTSIDVEKRIVDLTLDIQKGQVVIFERINIRGNSKTRDRVIRRELKVAEGDVYSQTLLDRSRNRVTALGFFESVDLSTTRGTADDRIVVNIEVKERATGTFQVGAGFSSVENFIVQAQVSQNNLFGRGQRLTLQAQMSGLRQLFLLSFQEPYFLDTFWTFGFDAYNSIRNYESFNRNATGGNLTWGYPITDDIRAYVTYTGEYVDVSTRGAGTLFGAGFTSPLPSGVQIANLFRSGFTSSLRFALQWDTRNNRLFPSKGFFLGGWAEFASKYIASQNVYNRYGGFGRFYYPIWGPIVFKVNSEIGLITSSEEAGVPISERYFLGGIMDVRGFKPRSLGPRVPVLSSLDPNESIYYFNKGGNKQLYFNVEIEFPIFEKVGIKGVVFTDAGNAFDDGEALSFTGLRHSAGFGFRWFSPIGPLRFEWGLPLSPNPGEDSIVFEFTIGNFF
jgi:outer membrane protein insertion porin family